MYYCVLYSVLKCTTVNYSVLQCTTMYYNVLLCITGTVGSINKILTVQLVPYLAILGFLPHRLIEPQILWVLQLTILHNKCLCLYVSLSAWFLFKKIVLCLLLVSCYMYKRNYRIQFTMPQRVRIILFIMDLNISHKYPIEYLECS